MPTKAAQAKPRDLTIRVYNAGFGDCMLLKFGYAGFERRVLIDFGTSAAPLKPVKNFMKEIAADIREQCREADGSSKLHAIVATHRHLDHISGFSTEAETGEVIAGLAPDVVVQPWTEDPDAPVDATQATVESYTAGKPDPATRKLHFRAALDHMHTFAESVALEAAANRLDIGRDTRAHLAFLGEQNLKNTSAVKNLMDMGRKARATYVHCGSASGLEDVLPGVTVNVLGPPTLEQCDEIRKESAKNPDEFWFHAFWGAQAVAGAGASGDRALFPGAPSYSADDIPPNLRWFVARAKQVRADQLLQIVRELDAAMNNTSVILLLQAGPLNLLFPGDAQWENWSYALANEGYRKLLAGVDVYKVGHHGSTNATPRSLWELFEKRRSRGGEKGVLTSLLSTRPGKHGSTKSSTEVPRRTLLAELETESELYDTETLTSTELYHEIRFDLSKGEKHAGAKDEPAARSGVARKKRAKRAVAGAGG
ncbi:MAG TPA: MBL fold metallo-hydrolase [Bryobacteraceae bacterium]|nr:MBL fold metallo-hydrolase [Bryobacteraceae bacterium]